MARCSRIQDPIGQLQTVTILSTFAFVITRHSCQRCVYLMVIVIFPLPHARLTFSLKRSDLCSFSLYLGGLGHFAIMWSSDPHPKHFRGGRSEFLLYEIPTARAFPHFLSDPFETFFRRMIVKSTKCALCMDRVCPVIVSTRPWDTVVKIQIICLQGWDVQAFLIRKLSLSSQFCLVAS